MRKVSSYKGKGYSAMTLEKSSGEANRSAGSKLPSASFRKKMWKSKSCADGTKFIFQAQGDIERPSGIRMLDRYGEAWFVVKDIGRLLGNKTGRFSTWYSIPEMERDVERIERSQSSRVWMKVVTLKGLTFLLSRTKYAQARAIIDWASHASDFVARNGAGEWTMVTPPAHINITTQHEAISASLSEG